jgi:hypothetical protein
MVSHLTFKWHVYAYTNTNEKTPLEINFIHLGNKEISCTSNTSGIISVLFSTKLHLFHNFIFLCSSNTYAFSINHALKFK